MRTLAVLVLASACRTPAPPPPANTASHADRGEPTLEPANCNAVGSDTLRVSGELARVEVLACDLGDRPADDQDPAGLQIRAWEGFVKVTRADGRTLRTRLAEWTDGWEWDGRVKLEGPLVAPGATNDAVLVSFRERSVDYESVTLRAFVVRGDALEIVGSWKPEMIVVKFSKRHDVARVQTCVIGDPVATHAGCGGRGDADPGPVLELRWTGTKLEHRVLATSP